MVQMWAGKWPLCLIVQVIAAARLHLVKAWTFLGNNKKMVNCKTHMGTHTHSYLCRIQLQQWQHHRLRSATSSFGSSTAAAAVL